MSALEPDDPRSVGEYRLLERLGAGGMGRVYLGRSPGGRLVAVKVVHEGLVRRPEFRDRFRREVQAARTVSGAFTAPVIDADPDAPLPYLVTSYIAGPSLEQAVAERGPFDSRAATALAAGLAEALRSIHAAHLVHRDLKPSNVLLAEDGPRVIDFGIVRSVEGDSLTVPGQMAGSPGFMSPEQVNGADVTPASDVFCLGAVLAFAATGQNPFGGGPTPALLYRVVHNAPDVGAIADPALRALVADCLAKDPAHRPTPREILTRIGPQGGERATVLSYPPAHPHPYPAGQYQPTLLAPAPAPEAPPPAGPARDRGRRAFLFSGAGALAAAAVGTGFWLNRSSATGSADGTVGSPSPSATATKGPQPLGHWPLDETSGTVVRDTAGDNNGTATGVTWGTGPDAGALFDGTRSQIITSGPALRTGAGQGFTVAAWVRLTAVPGTFATAVSQDADEASGFYLQYSSADKRWAFARPDVRAVSTTVPAAGVWTHLAGVCEGPNRRLRLYVNGVQEAVVEDTNPIAANGPLAIGRASYGNQPVDFFPGHIREVQVFDRTLGPERIRTLPR
ncbi:LamG-like jellyroll fold domain-containing protein [Streptomyces sp. NPDC023723]|uniref:protein kinase domain-containing protein n=1 Tax=Streptomyces sp. NPDC023723 TaxID=3154323 RepID=UPI0033C56DD4